MQIATASWQGSLDGFQIAYLSLFKKAHMFLKSLSKVVLMLWGATISMHIPTCALQQTYFFISFLLL
jgi:hypothetical protein